MADEAARLVGVGETTIKRWKRRPRDADTLARAPCPGRRSQIAPDQLPTLKARLRAARDAPLTD